MNRIQRVLGASLLQLSLIFGVLVLLQRTQLVSLPLDLGIFLLVLPLLALVVGTRPPAGEGDVGSPWGAAIAVLFAGAFALALRLLPYLRFEIPLGYDSGLYRYLFDIYFQALPHVPELGLPAWVKETYPQGLPLMAVSLHSLTGATSDQLLAYLFPLLSAGLILPLYLLARSTFGWRIGLVAALLYAASATQYTTFEFLYFKNVVALWLLLLALYALRRQRMGLFALFYAGLGFYHRPTFLLMTLALVPLLLLVGHRRMVIGAALAAALISLPWLVRLSSYAVVAQGAGDAALTNLLEGSGEGPGTFFGLAWYRLQALPYLPFALAGAIGLLLSFHRRAVIVLAPIGAAAAIVVFQLFFFRRYIIPLDLLLLAPAAVGLIAVFGWRSGTWLRGWVGVGGIALVVAVAAYGAYRSAEEARPLLSRSQLQSVQWLATNTEPDAYVLTTNRDAPWALGWSERRIIAPGLFEWNVHDRADWNLFYRAQEPELVRDFLAAYPGPLYIYHARNPDNQLVLDKFQEPSFAVVYDEGDAVIYRYDGGEE